MSYMVKEMFLTLQGEGVNMGRTAVFVRFAGCNLWSGREEDRADAICKFCDTEFRGGARYASPGRLVEAVEGMWPVGRDDKLVVLTGGEPLLQVDSLLISVLKMVGFTVAVETNGTVPLPAVRPDWVCVSPKAGAPLALDWADELKLVFPQPGAMPNDFKDIHAGTRWLSPMDGPHLRENMRKAAEYCIQNPSFRLNIQAHKVWEIA